MSRWATNRLSQTTTWTAFRTPAETRNLFFFYSTQKSSWSNGTSSPVSKGRQERDAVHRPPPSTSVKNECSCHCTPQYFFMASTGTNLPLPFPLQSTLLNLRTKNRKQTKREKPGEEGCTKLTEYGLTSRPVQCLRLWVSMDKIC